MNIEYSKWNIANRFPEEGVIEVNEYLKLYPKLYKAIMKHELQHEDTVFSMSDFKHDLMPTEKVSQWELMKFMIHHPKALTQLLPFYYSKKRGFHLDLNMSILYVIGIAVTSFFIFLIMKFVA